MGNRTLARASSALILPAAFFMAGALGSVRADRVLVAGPGQNEKSIGQFYFTTSMTQPAILAIRGGTILSIDDHVAILPPEV